MTEHHLRIGAFSTLSRLSVRMLRYYDERGILSPADVDPFSGYRGYSHAQLEDALFVRKLRDVGLSVSAIAALLPLRHDAEALGRALAVHRDQLLAEAAAAKRRLSDLDHLTTSLKEANMATITTTTVPAVRVASLRMQIPDYPSEGLAWSTIMGAAAAQGVPFLPEPCGATFHDDGYQERDVDIEVWLPIGDDTTVVEPLTAQDLPEQRVVVATLLGDYSGISGACDQLARHLADNDLTPAGHMFNRYLVGPGLTDNPDDYVTEVCVPVAS